MIKRSPETICHFGPLSGASERAAHSSGHKFTSRLFSPGHRAGPCCHWGGTCLGRHVTTSAVSFQIMTKSPMSSRRAPWHGLHGDGAALPTWKLSAWPPSDRPATPPDQPFTHGPLPTLSEREVSHRYLRVQRTQVTPALLLQEPAPRLGSRRDQGTAEAALGGGHPDTAVSPHMVSPGPHWASQTHTA